MIRSISSPRDETIYYVRVKLANAFISYQFAFMKEAANRCSKFWRAPEFATIFCSPKRGRIAAHDSFRSMTFNLARSLRLRSRAGSPNSSGLDVRQRALEPSQRSASDAP